MGRVIPALSKNKMKNETKKLCYWASKLYESPKMSSDQLYDLLVYSNSRVKEVAQARQMIGYILYNHSHMTLQEVAYEMGLTHHSTIIHWLDMVQVQLRTNKRIQQRYQFLFDVFNGIEREVIKQNFRRSEKNHLSNADMQFIKDNFDSDKNISYYADYLGKTRVSVKKYLNKINQIREKL